MSNRGDSGLSKLTDEPYFNVNKQNDGRLRKYIAEGVECGIL
jgi:hypothetical protein